MKKFEGHRYFKSKDIKGGYIIKILGTTFEDSIPLIVCDEIEFAGFKDGGRGGEIYILSKNQIFYSNDLHLLIKSNEKEWNEWYEKI